MIRVLLPILLTFVVSIALADEPLWTPDERAKQRDAVISGTVLRIDKVKAINDHEDLMSAEIRIERVLKEAASLPEGKVTVFYESSPKGAGFRCPTYAVLIANQTGTFYLRWHDHLTTKNDFVIEMGRDVAEVK